jgi:hypothetical protein
VPPCAFALCSPFSLSRSCSLSPSPIAFSLNPRPPISISPPSSTAPPSALRVKHGINRQGKKLHYYLNYSSHEQSFQYPYAAGQDILTGTAIAPNQNISIKPWDVAIVEEGVSH